MELGFIISGISEDETDSEEDESEEQYQQGKGKEKNVDGKFDQSRKSVGGSMVRKSAYRFTLHVLIFDRA